MGLFGRYYEEDGVAEEWVTIMMRCVSTVKYSVKINGRPRGCITPTRGLR